MLFPLNGQPPETWQGVLDNFLVIHAPGLFILVVLLLGIHLLTRAKRVKNRLSRPILAVWFMVGIVAYLLPSILVYEPWAGWGFRGIGGIVLVGYSLAVAFANTLLYGILQQTSGRAQLTESN